MIVAGMGFRKGADLGHDAAGQAADKQRQRRRRAAGGALARRRRHAARRRGVDREQVARHVDHAHEAPIAGHVNAMVVFGAQIDRGEGAVGIGRGQDRVTAHQRGGGVAVPLCLKDLIAADGAKLTDGAVHRTHVLGLGDGPRPGLEGAREEVVERGIRGDVRLGRLAHVHAVLAHEPADHRGGLFATLGPREGAGQRREGLLGQQVLGDDEKRRGHGTECNVRL